jgi:hypothetical protein
MGWNVAHLHQSGTDIKRDSFEPLPAEFQFRWLCQAQRYDAPQLIALPSKDASVSNPHGCNMNAGKVPFGTESLPRFE